MSKIRKVSAAVGQTLLVFFVSLVLAELTLRAYNSFNPSFIFYSDSYNRFRGKPFALDFDFHLNSKGFKDVEFDVQKSDGTFRVLAIGDSFAYGVVPYEHNYLTLVEKDLKRSGRKVEVINMGIPDLGPRHYLSLLVHEGLELKPDMVLVSFFVGNDFERKKTMRWYRHSYVASLLKYLVDLHEKFEGRIVHAAGDYVDDAPSFSNDFYVKLAASRSDIYKRHNEEFVRDFSNAVSYLVRIKEICDRHRIRLIVVIIPDEVQVNPLLQQEVVRANRFSPGEFDFAGPTHLLRQRFEQLNIQYIDLLNDFASAQIQVAVYKPNDSHWNISGNRLASDVIKANLSEQIPISKK